MEPAANPLENNTKKKVQNPPETKSSGDRKARKTSKSFEEKVAEEDKIRKILNLSGKVTIIPRLKCEI